MDNDESLVIKDINKCVVESNKYIVFCGIVSIYRIKRSLRNVSKRKTRNEIEDRENTKDKN